ncbi:hypothetical protein MRX96_008177 [Rhipicephalus microplus]
MDRLIASSELIGLPVAARLPADRSYRSGVVQGVNGDYIPEALLAAVTSEVPHNGIYRYWFSTSELTAIWAFQRVCCFADRWNLLVLKTEQLKYTPSMTESTAPASLAMVDVMDGI